MTRPSMSASPHPAFIATRIRDYRYFFLNLKPSRKHELVVACGGWERCAPDYRVDRADFGFYGLEYVAHGKGVLTVNGRKHELSPGSVFAYAPLTSHTIHTDASNPLVKFFVDFSGRKAKQIIGRSVLGEQGIAFLHSSQPVHDLYESMLDAGLKGGRFAPRLCALLLELLSVRIEEGARVPKEALGLAHQSFERSRGEIQKNFRTIRSVREVAQRCHLTSSYLSRLFNRFSGEGPYEMLTRLKLNEAAAHLIGGRYTIKEVAAEACFPDPYHFSRVFKKHFGLSPTLFRAARAHVQAAGRGKEGLRGRNGG